LNPEKPMRPPPLPDWAGGPIPYARPGQMVRSSGPPARFAVVGWLALVFGFMSVVANVIGVWLIWGWRPHTPARPTPSAVAAAAAPDPIPPPPPPPPKIIPFGLMMACAWPVVMIWITSGSVADAHLERTARVGPSTQA